MAGGGWPRRQRAASAAGGGRRRMAEYLSLEPQGSHLCGMSNESSCLRLRGLSVDAGFHPPLLHPGQIHLCVVIDFNTRLFHIALGSAASAHAVNYSSTQASMPSLNSHQHMLSKQSFSNFETKPQHAATWLEHQYVACCNHFRMVVC